MPAELREDTAAAVLIGLGVLPAGARPTVRPLSGGVANTVLAVRWDGGHVVVKQALPKLRVAADWTFDPGRTAIERDCLGYLGRILPAGAVPELLAFDADANVLVMSHAPEGGAVWKDRLLAGVANVASAALSPETRPNAGASSAATTPAASAPASTATSGSSSTFDSQPGSSAYSSSFCVTGTASTPAT